jgi:hypothetical protein
MEPTIVTGLLLILLPIAFNAAFFLLQRAFDYRIFCASQRMPF